MCVCKAQQRPPGGPHGSGGSRPRGRADWGRDANPSLRPSFGRGPNVRRRRATCGWLSSGCKLPVRARGRQGALRTGQVTVESSGLPVWMWLTPPVMGRPRGARFGALRSGVGGGAGRGCFKAAQRSPSGRRQEWSPSSEPGSCVDGGSALRVFGTPPPRPGAGGGRGAAVQGEDPAASSAPPGRPGCPVPAGVRGRLRRPAPREGPPAWAYPRRPASSCPGHEREDTRRGPRALDTLCPVAPLRAPSSPALQTV